MLYRLHHPTWALKALVAAQLVFRLICEPLYHSGSNNSHKARTLGLNSPNWLVTNMTPLRPFQVILVIE
jgi:hypothetical protein